MRLIRRLVHPPRRSNRRQRTQVRSRTVPRSIGLDFWMRDHGRMRAYFCGTRGSTPVSAEARDIGRCRLLGIFAHPDDETFCAGGTFAHYAEQGAEIMVVSATRGQAGQIRDAAVGNRGTIAAVREAELRLACERLSIA